MTAFVESCRGDRGRLRPRRRNARPRGSRAPRSSSSCSQDKKNILITTHEHPDPDALASAVGLCTLLQHRPEGREGHRLDQGPDQRRRQRGVRPRGRPQARAVGRSGPAATTTRSCSSTRSRCSRSAPCRRASSRSASSTTTAASAARSSTCPFCDVRPTSARPRRSSSATSWSWRSPISPALGATLLYAIESDLAGAAGQPGELDNIALSSLTLIADPRKLYQMRYVDLPQSYLRRLRAGAGQRGLRRTTRCCRTSTRSTRWSSRR